MKRVDSKMEKLSILVKQVEALEKKLKAAEERDDVRDAQLYRFHLKHTRNIRDIIIEKMNKKHHARLCMIPL